MIITGILYPTLHNVPKRGLRVLLISRPPIYVETDGLLTWFNTTIKFQTYINVMNEFQICLS